MLHGRLLAESLRIGAEVCVPDLRLTRVSREDVSGSVSTDQPRTWTCIDFEAEDETAEALAAAFARALLAEGGWYADFLVGSDHVVVFADRVFRYRSGDRAGRAEAVAYGLTVGVPAHQMEWAD